MFKDPSWLYYALWGVLFGVFVSSIINMMVDVVVDAEEQQRRCGEVCRTYDQRPLWTSDYCACGADGGVFLYNQEDGIPRD